MIPGTLQSPLYSQFPLFLFLSVVVNGELTFGGTDNTKFENQITFVPITKTSPASEFWGIDQSVAYGSKTILSSTSGIVDSECLHHIFIIS